MDPLTISLIAGAAIKGVTGMAQYIKGKKLAKQNIRPEYEIPMEIRDKLSTAQMLAYQGLPEEQKHQFLQNMQRSTQGALGGLSTRRAGLAGIGALAQTESDALTNLMSLDAQQKMQNIQNLQNVRSEVAGARDKAFDINKLQPFYEKADAATALTGAGLQNIMGAIDTGVDIAGQSQYAKTLAGATGSAGATGGQRQTPAPAPSIFDENRLPMRKRGVYGYTDEENPYV